MKCSLFVLAVLSSAVAFSAAPFEINGEFKKLSGAMPSGWTANKYKSNEAKWGEEKLVKGSTATLNAFAVKSGAVPMAFYTSSPLAAKNGDKMAFSAKIKGSGTVRIGAYLYDAKGYCGVVGKTFTATEKQSEVKFSALIADQKGRDGALRKVTGMRPFFEAGRNADVVFECIAVNKL